ncbi:unnamed protein product [Prunus armeniaca]
MIYDQFLIVDCPTAYNIIIGPKGPAQRANLLRHNTQIGSIKTAKRDHVSVSGAERYGANRRPKRRTPTPQAQPAEELETVALNEGQPDRCVKIGTTLAPSLRTKFIEFLQHYSEVFARSYDDMPSISLEIISHKLSISPAYKPVLQKRHSYDDEWYEAMRTEVDKLQAINFIR